MNKLFKECINIIRMSILGKAIKQKIPAEI